MWGLNASAKTWPLSEASGAYYQFCGVDWLDDAHSKTGSQRFQASRSQAEAPIPTIGSLVATRRGWWWDSEHWPVRSDKIKAQDGFKFTNSTFPQQRGDLEFPTEFCDITQSDLGPTKTNNQICQQSTAGSVQGEAFRLSLRIRHEKLPGND